MSPHSRVLPSSAVAAPNVGLSAGSPTNAHPGSDAASVAGPVTSPALASPDVTPPVAAAVVGSRAAFPGTSPCSLPVDPSHRGAASTVDGAATPMGHAAIAGDLATPGTPRQVILTGDRPTGPLHLGHYVGSLASRVALQYVHDQTILVADLQALTDRADRGTTLRAHVREVVLDYLAVGIDPAATTICLQSGLPELAELTMLYLNLVTVARLERNPTVRQEITYRGFDRAIPAGFLCYPVSQAADITGFRATLVPVGEDQLPMIELSNEIVARVNRLAAEGGTASPSGGDGIPVLPMARALVGATGRLPGVDGRKASKSLGNAIPLGASPEEITRLVRAMYTDAGHLRVSDPGQVEGNVVFAHLDAFDPDRDAVADLKAHYQRGGLGDMALKRRLEGILQETLATIRARREAAAQDLTHVDALIAEGTTRARSVVAGVLRDVRAAFGLG